MSVDSVPSKQTHTNQSAFNWRQYANAVSKPTASIFAYALTTSIGLLESLAFLLLWSRGGTVSDALYWFSIALVASMFLAGTMALSAYITFRHEYIDNSFTNHQRTDTEYKAVKAQPEPGERPMTKNENGSLLIGRHRFSHRQRRLLARQLSVGDNVSHEVLHQIGLASGDIKSAANRRLFNDIQGELVRLGYAAKNGRSTQLTDKGFREWLAHPPHPELEPG